MISKDGMSDLKDRVKVISKKLSDNMGYMSSGGLQWGARALKEMEGSINFEKVYAYIAAERRRKNLISLIKSDRAGITDIIANDDSPIESFMEQYGISEEDAITLQEEFSKTLKGNEVIQNISDLKISSTTNVLNCPVDMSVISFATMYTEGRIPYKDNNVIPPDQMQNICMKVDKLMEGAETDEEKAQISDDVLEILHDKYGKRRLTGTLAHRKVLFHECAKTMIKYGVVPSEEYREWGDQAIALACMWRKRRASVKWAIEHIATSLFDLSHFDEHPETIADDIVCQFEDWIEKVDEVQLPLGVCVRESFMQYEYYDEAYLFSILARLSFKCGRRKKKVRKKK